MDFILSQEELDISWEVILLNNNHIYYNKNSQIHEREIFIESDELCIIGDANISFIRSLKNNFSILTIEKSLDNLKNGYVIVYNKVNGITHLYTDIFGFYQLFYIERDNSLIISSEFIELIKFSDKATDKYAFLDILLFNYTLLNRTIISDIKRIKGGSKVILTDTSYEIACLSNFADNFSPLPNNSNLDHRITAELLKNSLSEDLATTAETYLSMTAGFDSRMLLGVSKNLNIDLSSFTFGQRGNIEQETIKNFIGDYSNNHIFFELDQAFIDNVSVTLDDFISINMDNPVILDLPQYAYIQKKIKGTNLIFGFMGGELMTGQSIGSQVTFTQAAAALLQSNNIAAAELSIKSIAAEWPFVNIEYLKNTIPQYIQTLTEYFYKEDKTNILRFLLNESYVKFFGSVNKAFKNQSNLIVPFIDSEYINYILNSNVSFLYKEPFVNNPFVNFKSKISYAKTIKYLYPPLAKTKLDRLYEINDLCLFHKLPKAGFGYFRSHVLKKNKKNYPKPHHYDLWYSNIILNQLKNKELSKNISLFSDTFKIEAENYLELTSIEKKKLANISGLFFALNKLKAI